MLKRRFEEAAGLSPGDLYDLRRGYEEFAALPAGKHFYGALLHLRAEIEQGILKGRQDRFGRDVTPELRASYGTLLQILDIPDQVRRMHDEAVEALGMPPLTNPTTRPYLAG